MKCSHVHEVAQGVAYVYCNAEGTVIVGGNPYCPEHGSWVERLISAV